MKTLYRVWAIFCPNELIILVSTGCSFVKTTSYRLSIDLILNLWADVLLKSIITLIANFLYKKCIALVFSSYLCLLWSELFFIVIFHTFFLQSSPFSICFSFKHNIQSLSLIESLSCILNILWVIDLSLELFNPFCRMY